MIFKVLLILVAYEAHPHVSFTSISALSMSSESEELLLSPSSYPRLGQGYNFIIWNLSRLLPKSRKIIKHKS